MNTYLAKNILHLITSLRRQPLRQALKFLQGSQWWSHEEILSYQTMKFNKLLNHCSENVPFYREWFKKNGYTARDISLQNIGLLPLINKSLLKDNLKEFIAQDYHETVENAKTSGSTGVPLQFPKSLGASAVQLAAMYRGHMWHGIDVGAKEARLWGIPLNVLSRYKTYCSDILLNRFRERDFNLNFEILNDFHIQLHKRRPQYLMGYPSMVSQFARFLLDNGLNGLELELKMVKCTSETIYDEDREIIERVFGCQLINEYGAAETGLICFQCAEGSLHLMSDCCITEFIEMQEDVGTTDFKEIIVTNLDNYATPFIRYRIGDIAIPSSSSCRCGRHLPVVDKIIGRVSDIIKTSDGGQRHSSIFSYIMKGLIEKYSGIIQFRTVQREIDKLEIYLMTNKSFNKDAEGYLRNQCTKKLGKNMKIDIKFVDNIPRDSSGKIRYFVSMI